MYRKTRNNVKDIKGIVEIYNKITNRNRTVEQHQWEWFSSPNKNLSYVITTNENKIIGHHGILSVELDFKGQHYKMGKTENTIMKKGFGAVYPKNEMAMHKEYSTHYDVIMTTAAWGVTRRIREKLGYQHFANYVTYVSLLDFGYISTRINNVLAKHFINFISPLGNFFLRKKSVNDDVFFHQINKLSEGDLDNMEALYTKVNDKYGFIQVRTSDFLKYRYLDNPYTEFEVIYLYKNSEIVGSIIYSIFEEKLIIEDVLFNEKKQLQEMLNNLLNYAKNNKLAKLVIFTTLENSLLDLKYKYFIRKKASPENSVVMVKNNIEDIYKERFKVENFYFTRLTNEGIR